MNAEEYLDVVKYVFYQHRNPQNAGPMKAYMKHKFDFLGIKSPLRKELSAPFFLAQQRPSEDQIWPVINSLWELNEREFQYLALDLLTKYKKVVKEDWITHFETLAISKSWWDTVDGIAAEHIGNYFKTYPYQVPDVTKRWMASGNMWLQRSCLLFQLKYKDKTDTKLLARLINDLSGSREFFIRKAIGWSLRQYSKYDPVWVKAFAGNNELNSLSAREALRLIN